MRTSPFAWSGPRMPRSSRCSAAFPRIASSGRRATVGGRRSSVPGSASIRREIPRARHRLSRRSRRQFGAAAELGKFPPLSSFDQAEALAPHRPAPRAANRCTPSSAHPTAAWWRCASRSAIAALRGPHRRAERRRQVAGAVDGVAQRAAADRARGDRARRRAARAQARARAGDGDLPQRGGVRAALRRGRRCARRTDSAFPIEDYLFARGDDYVQKYRAETFLALSESIDLHQMDATRGAHAGHADCGARGPAGAVQRHAGSRGAPQRAAPADRDQFHIRSRRVLEGGRGAHPHHQAGACGARHERNRSNLENPWPRARCAPGSNRTRSTAPWCRRSICRRTSRSKATASRASTTTRAPAIRRATSWPPRSRIWRAAPARW